MLKTFHVTPRAKEDLRKIWQYSQKIWGKRQANKYVTEIHHCFEWLLENQILWRDRSEVKVGYYSYLQGKHIIFFTKSADSIHIIGIPYQGMDVIKYFYH